MQRVLSLRKSLLRRFDQGERYRNRLSARLGLNLEQCVVSTAEHIAPFNFASTVSFVFPQMLIERESDKYTESILILGCSLIPLDNSDYPRGFVLPDGKGGTIRVNLWPRRLRKAVPLLLPARRCADLPELEGLLSRHPYLTAALDEQTGHLSYAGQLANVMEAMTECWPAATGRPRVRVAPGEEVAAAMLIDLLRDGDPIVSRLVEDVKARASLRQKLDGVFCAWGGGRGSFLFWGATNDNSGQVVPVAEQDGCLVGDGVSVPLRADAVAEALATKKLIPGVALSLFAVSWLGGVPIAGGPKQKCYWEHMIEAFNELVPASQARPLWLSQYGYGELTWDETSRLIGVEDVGTGLSLAAGSLSLDAARNLISQSTSRPVGVGRYA